MPRHPTFKLAILFDAVMIDGLIFTASKKKFAVLAKKFFTTARPKKKRATGKIVRDLHGPSTLNLLDDHDDEDLIDAAHGLDHDVDVLFEPLVRT